MEILWACHGDNASSRLDWARAAATQIRLDVKIATLENADLSIATWRSSISRADFVVADFMDDDGPISPNVITAATLARHCSAKPTYIICKGRGQLPFDWARHGQVVPTTGGANGRHGLQAWFREAVLQTEHQRGKPLLPHQSVLPPEVFVAMPFQGYVPAELPHPGAFDFSRFLAAAEAAAASVEYEPKPVVTVVGRSSQGGDIFDNVEQRIAAAAVVIADFSCDEHSRPHPNPNVITEATIARAGFGHERTLILCAQLSSEIPSPWRTFETTFYDPVSMTTAQDTLTRVLARRITTALQQGRTPADAFAAVESASAVPVSRPAPHSFGQQTVVPEAKMHIDAVMAAISGMTSTQESLRGTFVTLARRYNLDLPNHLCAALAATCGNWPGLSNPSNAGVVYSLLRVTMQALPLFQEARQVPAYCEAVLPAFSYPHSSNIFVHVRQMIQSCGLPPESEWEYLFRAAQYVRHEPDKDSIAMTLAIAVPNERKAQFADWLLEHILTSSFVNIRLVGELRRNGSPVLLPKIRKELLLVARDDVRQRLKEVADEWATLPSV